MTTTSTYAFGFPIAGLGLPIELDDEMRHFLGGRTGQAAFTVRFLVEDLIATFGTYTDPRQTFMMADRDSNIYVAQVPMDTVVTFDNKIDMNVVCLGDIHEVYPDTRIFRNKLIGTIAERSSKRVHLRMEIMADHPTIIESPFNRFNILPDRKGFDMSYPRHSIDGRGDSKPISNLKENQQ